MQCYKSDTNNPKQFVQSGRLVVCCNCGLSNRLGGKKFPADRGTNGQTQLAATVYQGSGGLPGEASSLPLVLKNKCYVIASAIDAKSRLTQAGVCVKVDPGWVCKSPESAPVGCNILAT